MTWAYVLISLNASALQTVGGDLYFSTVGHSYRGMGSGLTKLSFESLSFVGEHFRLQSCNSLTVAYFGSLESICHPDNDGRFYYSGAEHYYSESNPS